MNDDQFDQLTRLMKTQNEMIARIGFILVRMTWLMITGLIILFTAWLFFFLCLYL